MKIQEDFLDTMSTLDATTKVLPQRFTYKKYTVQRYTYCEDGDLPLIRAFVDNTIDVKNLETNVHCEKPDLLFEMLLLREKLSNQLFDVLANTQYLVNCISQEQVNTIIKWCQKNGYPFQIDQKPQRKNKFKEMTSIVEDFYCVQFDLLEFLKELNEIYSAFKLYQVMTDDLSEEDYSIRIAKVKESSSSSLRKELKFVPLITRKPSSEVEKKEAVERCKSLFLEKYNDRSFNMHLIPDRERVFITEVQTDNLFDAAFYQLALLLDRPKTQIKQCPLCRRYFQPSRTNQKYCDTKNENKKPTCYAQLHYKQTHSKQKEKRASE